MTKFLNCFNQKIVNSKRGKIFYFVGMTIAIIMVIVFFTLFLLSILNAGIFMPEFSSYEYLLSGLKYKYLSDETIEFYSNSNYSFKLYYYEYSIQDLFLNISIEDKQNSINHNIIYFLYTNELNVNYAYRNLLNDNYFSFNYKLINNQLEIDYFFSEDYTLNESTIALADAARELGQKMFFEYAITRTWQHNFDSVLSDYLTFDQIVRTVFIVSLVFLIVFFLLFISMLTLYIVVKKKKFNFQANDALVCNNYNDEILKKTNDESLITTPSINKTDSVNMITTEKMETLKNYKNLLDNDIISEDEFNMIKSKLLDL